jgi:hypothetical protein
MSTSLTLPSAIPTSSTPASVPLCPANPVGLSCGSAASFYGVNNDTFWQFYCPDGNTSAPYGTGLGWEPYISDWNTCIDLCMEMQGCDGVLFRYGYCYFYAVDSTDVIPATYELAVEVECVPNGASVVPIGPSSPCAPIVNCPPSTLPSSLSSSGPPESTLTSTLLSSMLSNVH